MYQNSISVRAFPGKPGFTYTQCTSSADKNQENNPNKSPLHPISSLVFQGRTEFFQGTLLNTGNIPPPLL